MSYFGLLLLTIAKRKNVEKNKNNENDENDEEEVYCICIQPWGNRLVTTHVSKRLVNNLKSVNFVSFVSFLNI